MRLYSVHRWLLFTLDLICMIAVVSLFNFYSGRFAEAQLYFFIILAFCFAWFSVYGNNDFKLDYYTLALRTSLIAAGSVLLYLIWAQQRRLAFITIEIFAVWLVLAHITRFLLKRVGPRFKVLIPLQGAPLQLEPDIRMQYDYQTSPSHLKLRHYDLIVIMSDTAYSEEWRKFIASARGKGVPILFHTEFYEEQFGKISLESFQHPWLDHSFSVNWFYLKGRRLVDIIVASVAAPFLLVIGFFISIAIAISMGRPIFFTQQRIGQHNTIFKMYKFRSMKPIPPHSDTHVYCAERVTPLGHFLRRHRLDELPQFLNILKGEMTLIGPRPDSVKLARKYSHEIPVYNMRHLVKPGLTGWSQVSQGHISTVEGTIEKLQYDLFYIKNFAFWLDFKIVLKTILTLVTGFGAR